MAKLTKTELEKLWKQLKHAPYENIEILSKKDCNKLYTKLRNGKLLMFKRQLKKLIIKERKDAFNEGFTKGQERLII